MKDCQVVLILVLIGLVVFILYNRSRSQEVVLTFPIRSQECMRTSKGNVDLNFLTMMIKHHQGGVDMSQEYLSDPMASNPKIKQLAIHIINAQTSEIQEMQRLELQIKDLE